MKGHPYPPNFSNFTATSGYYSHSVTVSVNSSATPGFRLAIAKDSGGTVVQAGLIGTHVLAKLEPTRITTSIAEQMLGKYDFTKLNPEFWK